MKRLALLLVLVLPAHAITLPQWAAGTTIIVNVIELPVTIAKAKALWRRVHPKKPKTTPVDCLTTQPAGTPCPMAKEKK
jgi:hypothetical protein